MFFLLPLHPINASLRRSLVCLAPIKSQHSSRICEYILHPMDCVFQSLDCLRRLTQCQSIRAQRLRCAENMKKRRVDEGSPRYMRGVKLKPEIDHFFSSFVSLVRLALSRSGCHGTIAYHTYYCYIMYKFSLFFSSSLRLESSQHKLHSELPLPFLHYTHTRTLGVYSTHSAWIFSFFRVRTNWPECDELKNLLSATVAWSNMCNIKITEPQHATTSNNDSFTLLFSQFYCSAICSWQ